MGKRLVLLIFVITTLFVVGCSNNRIDATKLEYEELSKREEYLLNATGNKILMYNLKNLPKGKVYELNLVYEVYKDSKKIKDEIITGIGIGGSGEEGDSNTSTDTNPIIINLQENKIRYLLGIENGYSNGSIDIEENLQEYTYTYLTNDANLNIGEEIYIFHGISKGSEFSNISLGRPVSEEELNRILGYNNENVFIKVVYKEVKNKKTV